MKYYLFFLTILLLLTSCEQEEKNKLFTLVSSENSGVRFSNEIVETNSSNILTNEYIFNGGGVAVGDFNNDQKPDLFYTGNQVANALYLNQGDLKFKDVSQISGIRAQNRWSTGMALADVNADGWLDIYVCAAMSSNEAKRSNMLFVNQGLDETGIPVFKEKAEEYGIADNRNSMAATFFDYDKDGLLDLYVLNNEQVHTLPTNYRPKIVDGSAVSNDRLYHNNGDGTFTDVTLDAGILYEGFGLGIAVADFNYDGWPDIHVSNDYLTNDVLYINNTDGTFSNKIELYIKHQSKFSMGSDVADYNNDGLLDLITLDMLGETNYRMKTTIRNNNYISYMLNERHGYEYQYMRNMLHKGNGLGIPSSEIGLLAGIAKTDWSWSPLFADMDNDGFRDLLVTNGFPRDITDTDFADFNLSVHQYLSPAKILDSIPVIKIPNYAYRNKGDLTFEDVGESWGLNIPSFSNGAAFSDLDADGDLDYVVNNINNETFLFENNSEKEEKKGSFLRVKLKGEKNNPFGIGAKVVIRYSTGEFQYHEHYLNRGYMSSVESTIHFGLGKKNKVKSLEVMWPDGRFEKQTEIEPDQTITVNIENASSIDTGQLLFPLIPKENSSLFKEVSTQLGIDFKHKEADVVDYNLQRTLPHKLSQNGPAIVAGDINGDGLEDFIIGSSSKYSPSIFLQDVNGKFTERAMFLDKNEMRFEEEDMALFDFDNDGDLDIYLVSGSYEFEEGSNFFNDRLYLNDGEGNFTKTTQIPIINANGSVVAVQDFDNDGFKDLFVGGRTKTGKYPYPERSFLLKNEGGRLRDVTEEYAPDLKDIGMVTDAIWQDINADGKKDLILVGEFMSITVFKNQETGFQKLVNTGIDEHFGWWESIISEDFDGDGDFDFIAGNLGQNSFYCSTFERPVTIKAKDFDENGSVDPITFAYLKGEDGKYQSFPTHFWGDINKQSTIFRSKYDYFKEYAQSTEETLLSLKELEGAITLKANYNKTSYIENLGNGTFKIHSLPLQAQLSPINDMQILDYDEDGDMDVLLIGNDYGNETFVGRYDASNGLLLKNDGAGNFVAIDPSVSGFIVPGDAKSIIKVKNKKYGDMYISTQNRGKILTHARTDTTLNK